MRRTGKFSMVGQLADRRRRWELHTLPSLPRPEFGSRTAGAGAGQADFSRRPFDAINKETAARWIAR